VARVAGGVSYQYCGTTCYQRVSTGYQVVADRGERHQWRAARSRLHRSL